MSKKKPTYIENVNEKISNEELTKEILKDKMRLIQRKITVSKNIRLAIATGNHDVTHSSAKELQQIEAELKSVEARLSDVMKVS